MFFLLPHERPRRLVLEPVVRPLDHSPNPGTYKIVSVSRYLNSASITPARIVSSFIPSSAREASDVCHQQPFRQRVLPESSTGCNEVAQRTMGNACCFSTSSWICHSCAISSAMTFLLFGMTSRVPDGVFRFRLSSKTR